MSEVVEVRALTKAYGDLVAVEPLDLDVAEGEVVMLVGPNGSGKTTLLRMIAGLIEPTAGDVMIDGSEAGSFEARAALSYVPDNPVLYDDLTLAEHLHYVARLHGVGGDEAEERGRALMEHLNLSGRADDLPVTFSRGLRQKTSIALGLIRPFSVLVIDEPFVGLDQPGKSGLLDLIGQAHHQGGTVIVATHSLEFADAAQRCLALRDGALTYDGPPSPAEVARLVS
jgi:ABC-type multidrug transport system ATPase subunit